MARQSRWVVAAIVFAAIGSPAVAWAQASGKAAPQQQPQPQQARDGRRDNHERRPWWRNTKDIAEIGITAEQSDAIDAIFHAEIEKMKPLREVVIELERGLNATIRASTTDVTVFARQVQKIESKRAELNTMRTVMLYRMRQVLSAEQNARFQAMLDRWDAARKKQDAERRK